MKVLLLSAYAAQSHVYWQDTLVAMFPEWHWRILTLPPRHFNWRVRGNPLYWSLSEREALEAGYDLVLATSMVDLATLRGLVPALSAIPSIIYFHENQFEYPAGTGGKHQARNLLEAQMVSLYSSLAADKIVFNSRYNQDSFFTGCEALLKKLPDKVPDGIVLSLMAKSAVVPVPIRSNLNAGNSRWPGTAGEFTERPLRLLWVGRFEYDKGADHLLRALQHLERLGLSYELALVGQQFRHSPETFLRIETMFKHRLVHFGYIESVERYAEVLSAADVVFSTALHEFQGISVLEAVAAGCIPVVPDRLVYPESYPQDCCYSSCPQDPEEEAAGAARHIVELAQSIRSSSTRAPDVSAFSAVALEEQYRVLFSSLR